MTHPEMAQCALAHSDAAYVLGALSPADRLEFERHLPGCERCRRSVSAAGLPGLLGRVSREQVEEPLPFEPLPETVLPALVAAVRREQRRKTVLVTLGAAAAVAVVALGVAAMAARDEGREPSALPTTTTSSSNTSTPAPAHPMDVVVDYGVRAEVSLTQVKWGTKVGINCHYAARDEGYDSSHAYRYNLVVYTRNGKPDQVSSWRTKPGEAYVADSITAAKLEQITRVEVQSAHGQTILRLSL